jgi:hypothetical protein
MAPRNITPGIKTQATATPPGQHESAEAAALSGAHILEPRPGPNITPVPGGLQDGPAAEPALAPFQGLQAALPPAIALESVAVLDLGPDGGLRLTGYHEGQSVILPHPPTGWKLEVGAYIPQAGGLDFQIASIREPEPTVE